MAGLRKEVWVKQLMEKFYPVSSFLNYVKDFSPLVDNDAINLAEAGIDPKVLVNNTTYPIAVVKRDDKPIRIELDLFETENTLVRRPDAIEYAYDQLESVLMGHRNVLKATTGAKAAHAYAPDEDTDETPVIQTTGDAYKGRKRLTIEDILLLKERFDNANVPLEERYMVLHPSHLTDLILFDIKAFKSITDFVNGEPNRLAGFGMLQFSQMAYYDGDLKKKAFGSAIMDGDAFCSLAFQRGEVMKADGQVHMYATIDDPKERGAIVGFDKRFVALPIRNKGIGAIVSTNA
ncbi:hypothetical protein D0T84_21520 [Dysgonomonas sp. 521]|uniref:hypothetical protein n=1 Tax=Dysgonomonas sp. 521 TaxID=2302932 RepID=UPI0013D0B0D4|nr:hypothetical protein [Dysgonomonas sp. 521]NDV97452.1 hypothetical protein [Dysgonomonas sp. 521]